MNVGTTMKTTLVFLALYLVSTTAWAQSGDAIADPDAFFLQLEDRLMQAVMDRDREGMEALLGEDYLLTSSDSNGRLINKANYIAGSMNADVLEAKSFEFLALSAQMVREDVAIVRSQLDWESTYRGAPWNAAFLMTDLWSREADGQWHLISRHSSYPADMLPRIVKERYSQ